MKKLSIFRLFMALAVVFSLSNCTSEKAKLIEDLNYRKACEMKDYLTAYEIVDKLKEKTLEWKIKYDIDYNNQYVRSNYVETEKKSDEAEKYVVLNEAISVLESEGSHGLMRIIGIAKEHDAEPWLYYELIDVAMKIGDSDLEERIKEIIFAKSSSSENLNDDED